MSELRNRVGLWLQHSGVTGSMLKHEACQAFNGGGLFEVLRLFREF
jgi:hypothetical protein